MITLTSANQFVRNAFVFFLLCGSCLTANTAAAAASDGNALLRQCTEAIKIMEGIADPDSIDFGQAGRCMGEVDGFAGASAFYEKRPGAPRAICFPEDGITIGQSVRVVEKYLREHPQELHESSTVLLFGAFLSSYPCPR